MDRKDFLAAIEADEDNVTNRLMYADWLEERGEIDEALRQRAWIPAKEEFIDLLELRTELKVDEDHFYELYIPTFKEFLNTLTSHSENTDYMSFGNRESLMHLYHNNIDRIWELWAILTGKKPPNEKPHGGCSC